MSDQEKSVIFQLINSDTAGKHYGSEYYMEEIGMQQLTLLMTVEGAEEMT